MVAVKKEVEEMQMSLNLGHEGCPINPNDIYYKQNKEQETIEAVHEIMGGSFLGKFICITKDNEKEYLEAYAKAKAMLHLSQFRNYTPN